MNLAISILLIIGMVAVEPSCNPIDFNLISQQRLTGYTFQVYENVNTVFSCARWCLLRSICESFNYNEETLECELNWYSESLAPRFDVPSSMLYGVAADIPQSIVGTCEDHDCLCHQICVPLDAGALCMDIGGVSTPFISNATQKVVNATYIEYTCDEGFTVEGDSTAECIISSTVVYWTTYFTCNFIDTTDCYILTNGIAVYSGTHGVNSEGDTCLDWADDFVVDKQHYDDSTMLGLSFPSAALSESGNYCRDVQRNGNLYCPVKGGPGHVDEILCDVILPCT